MAGNVVTMMKAVTAPDPGGPEALRFGDVARPVPGAEELLVRVTAIGVNRVDAMQRAGIYPPPPGSGPVLGVEFAGEVAETGKAVSGFKPGERVFALVAHGAYADYVAVDHRHVVRTPPDWDDVTAAAVIETVCTANETLFELGHLSAGETALIHAAGSAVGTMAVQMAAHAGANVIATAGAEAKIAGAKRLGAQHVINYKTADFAEEVLKLRPEGVDFVEDFIGSPCFARHLRVLAWKGRMVQVGLLAPGTAEVDTAPILAKRLTVAGFTLRPQSIEEKAGIVARFTRRWLPKLVSGAVEPVMHAVVPFAEVREAHRILEANENFGKVVMTVA